MTDDKHDAKNIRDYYNTFSDTYENRRHAGYHLMVDDLETELITDVCAGKKTLEVGCGTGLILSRVAKIASHAEGIDLSPGMLELSRQKGLDVSEASATDLPFEDNSFDVCYSFKVLSHVPDLKKALAEMSRVTKADGKVFIELYNTCSLRYLIRLLRGGEKISDNVDDNQVFFKFYSRSQMQNALPPELEIKKIHGVRILTVIPAMVGWPIIGNVLRWFEKTLRSSFFGRLGGFLILECNAKKPE